MQLTHVNDTAVLRAYANPARLRLLDLLRAHGPATVGMLAERSGDAVGSVSHHVKRLAQAGLIEPAPDLARDRRERWWRTSDAPPASRSGLDGAAAGAALSAEEITLERHTAYSRRALHQDDPGWSSFAVSRWLRLTAEELDALEVEIGELLARYEHAGSGDRTRPGAEPVLVFTRGLHVNP